MDYEEASLHRVSRLIPVLLPAGGKGDETKEKRGNPKTAAMNLSRNMQSKNPLNKIYDD